MAYDISGAPTYYEQMPRDLIDCCLECKRKRCTGNCKQYKQIESKILSNGKLDSNGKPIVKRGKPPKRHLFRGTMITVAEMAELLGVTKRSIRAHMERGMSMEQVYAYFERKFKL